jgi:hypothetical protein
MRCCLRFHRTTLAWAVKCQLVIRPHEIDLVQELALRAKLERAGEINHDHLFFKENGEPIRNLQYPYIRWRQTLSRLRGVRYRKPYCARHSSVSWDVMTGRSALWVARQHGHGISTMLRFYAAWTEGAIEADIAAIQAAMTTSERPARPESNYRVRRPKRSRSSARPFEMELVPAVSATPTPQPAPFASGICQW